MIGTKSWASVRTSTVPGGWKHSCDHRNHWINLSWLCGTNQDELTRVSSRTTKVYDIIRHWQPLSLPFKTEAKLLPTWGMTELQTSWPIHECKCIKTIQTTVNTVTKVSSRTLNVHEKTHTKKPLCHWQLFFLSAVQNLKSCNELHFPSPVHACKFCRRRNGGQLQNCIARDSVGEMWFNFLFRHLGACASAVYI